jgi:hypothetical protein
MKYKHKWEVLGDPGMYDTLYQCVVCEEKNMESADSMATWNPVYGCNPPEMKDSAGDISMGVVLLSDRLLWQVKAWWQQIKNGNS